MKNKEKCQKSQISTETKKSKIILPILEGKNVQNVTKNPKKKVQECD